MKKYFILAVVFAFFAIGLGASPTSDGGPVSAGFGVSAGLCIVAAAIAERRKSGE